MKRGKSFTLRPAPSGAGLRVTQSPSPLTILYYRTSGDTVTFPHHLIELVRRLLLALLLRNYHRDH